MSLLNDALKKAQSMQGQPRPTFPAPSQPAQPNPPQPAPAAQTPQAVEQTGRAGPGTKTILGIAAGVFIATVGVLGVGGYLLFSKVNNPVPQEVATAAATQPTPPPASAAPARQTMPVPPAPAPAPQPVEAETMPVAQPGAVPSQPLPVAHDPAPAEAPPAASENTAETVAITRAPVAQAESAFEAEPVAPEPEQPAVAMSSRIPEPEHIASVDGVIIEAVPNAQDSLISSSGTRPDPAIEGWVAQINLAGVRLGSSPKVLMNDRVYEVGDVVDKRSGLVLSSIEPRELQFRDPANNTYVLRF